MSYILDALKRADAERERGVVPGLHSQTATRTPAAASVPAQDRRPLLAVLGLCALLLLAAALWWFTRTAPPARVPAAAPTPSAPAASLPVPAPPAALPADHPVAPPPQAITAPLPVPPILRPEPAVANTAPASTPPQAAPSGPSPAPTQPPVANSSDAAVRRFADLSPEQRAQLPALSVSGASYSANPAHRMLIVNGVVAYEGQELAPGLTLERIGLHQAVIRQGGLRFSIAY